MNELAKINETIFENIKHIDNEGYEYWYARELQKVLEYTEWRKFVGVIKKAINSCKTSNYVVSDHFVGADKMVGYHIITGFARVYCFFYYTNKFSPFSIF